MYTDITERKDFANLATSIFKYVNGKYVKNKFCCCDC